MTGDAGVISRYEAKYLVPEALVSALRAAIRGVCSLDRHAEEGGRYLVNTLYFDTDDLRLYFDTRHRRYRRFKLRVRYYGARPGESVWIETKHKVRNVTWKTRARIETSRWPGVLDWAEAGGRGAVSAEASLPVPASEPPVASAGASLAAPSWTSFAGAVAALQARPLLLVRYVREAYVSDLDPYGRITFDRRLTYRPAFGSPELVVPGGFEPFDDSVSAAFAPEESPVVLEIKTEAEVPEWVIRLIRRFELSQRGFSKYCCAVEGLMNVGRAGGRVSALA